jgi:hypothetical protein
MTGRAAWYPTGNNHVVEEYKSKSTNNHGNPERRWKDFTDRVVGSTGNGLLLIIKVPRGWENRWWRMALLRASLYRAPSLSDQQTYVLTVATAVFAETFVSRPEKQKVYTVLKPRKPWTRITSFTRCHWFGKHYTTAWIPNPPLHWQNEHGTYSRPSVTTAEQLLLYQHLIWFMSQV